MHAPRNYLSVVKYNCSFSAKNLWSMKMKRKKGLGKQHQMDGKYEINYRNVKKKSVSYKELEIS